MGIPTIGKTAAKAISQHCHGNPVEFEYLLNQNFDWTSLDDFGEVTSEKIKQWFSDTINTKTYIELLNRVHIEQPVMQSQSNSVFMNKTVVVTGSLQHFTRGTITSKLEELGAKVSDSVSKKTDYLIVGDKAGSKLSKAKQLGINIISENDFNDFLEMTS